MTLAISFIKAIALTAGIDAESDPAALQQELIKKAEAQPQKQLVQERRPYDLANVFFAPEAGAAASGRASSSPALSDSSSAQIALQTAREVFGDSLDFRVSGRFNLSFDGERVPPEIAQAFTSRLENLSAGAILVPVIALRHPDFENPQSEAVQKTFAQLANELGAIDSTRILPASQFVVLPPDNERAQIEVNCLLVIGEVKQQRIGGETPAQPSNAPQSASIAPASFSEAGPTMSGWGGPYFGPGHIKYSDDFEFGTISFGGAGPVRGRIGASAGIGVSVSLGDKPSDRQNDFSGFFAEGGVSLRLVWQLFAEAGVNVVGLSDGTAYGNYVGIQYYPANPGPGIVVRYNSARFTGEGEGVRKIPTMSEHGIWVGLRWNFGRPE